MQKLYNQAFINVARECTDEIKATPRQNIYIIGMKSFAEQYFGNFASLEEERIFMHFQFREINEKLDRNKRKDVLAKLGVENSGILKKTWLQKHTYNIPSVILGLVRGQKPSDILAYETEQAIIGMMKQIQQNMGIHIQTRFCKHFCVVVLEQPLSDTEREEIRMRLKKRNEEDNVAFIINPEYVQNFIPQIQNKQQQGNQKDNKNENKSDTKNDSQQGKDKEQEEQERNNAMQYLKSQKQNSNATMVQ
ncbi:MAG: hypothetical protein EZS28_001747 [Streblomastix strix]|uniref:Uncharacterized protein n=1 Tax=Streblomastix strix TaxID=222440 RepID=A0A5J4X6C1_9EUKA|nr:MAG: hypothetical protein EZS28_001747 [Streblomastix strix]